MGESMKRAAVTTIIINDSK